VKWTPDARVNYAPNGLEYQDGPSWTDTDGMGLTPSTYEMSNRRLPTPTCTFPSMLLMSPGKVSGTDIIIAAAARQFYECYEKQDVSYSSRSLPHHKCTYTCRVADTSKERRHGYGVRANTTANKVKAAIDFRRKRW
jgi:hypothetical protein